MAQREIGLAGWVRESRQRTSLGQTDVFKRCNIGVKLDAVADQCDRSRVIGDSQSSASVVGGNISRLGP
jgi:hypothetical protein